VVVLVIVVVVIDDVDDTEDDDYDVDVELCICCVRMSPIPGVTIGGSQLCGDVGLCTLCHPHASRTAPSHFTSTGKRLRDRWLVRTCVVVVVVVVVLLCCSLVVDLVVDLVKNSYLFVYFSHLPYSCQMQMIQIKKSEENNELGNLECFCVMHPNAESAIT
jgi:hypothetical protein